MVQKRRKEDILNAEWVDCIDTSLCVCIEKNVNQTLLKHEVQFVKSFVRINQCLEVNHDFWKLATYFLICWLILEDSNNSFMHCHCV